MDTAVYYREIGFKNGDKIPIKIEEFSISIL
jgi:hypothetical protein